MGQLKASGKATAPYLETRLPPPTDSYVGEGGNPAAKGKKNGACPKWEGDCGEGEK